MKATTKGGTAAVVLAAVIAAPAMAQDYPSESLQYIVPFGPGGEVDLAARLQQPLFKEITGQQMVISYRPGGGGAVAWSQMNEMRADGYGAVAFSLPHIILKPIAGDVGFETEDVGVVHVFHYSPDAIVVRNDSPFETLDDLLEAAREQPGAITFSGTGTYTANHVAQQRFDSLADITTTYIPFKGTAAAVTGLLSGTTTAQWGYTTVAAAHMDDVRMLAVALEERHPLFPDVPTFGELGIDMIGGAFRGVAVPAETPEERKQALSDIFQEINEDPEFLEKMENLGFAILNVEYEEVDEFMAERREEYMEVARDFGLVD